MGHGITDRDDYNLSNFQIEGKMSSNNKENSNMKNFEPLTLMGLFWSIFGIIVLFASFFINETPLVPYFRGVFTNIIAGLILFLVGLFSLLKGRKNQALKNQEQN